MSIKQADGFTWVTNIGCSSQQFLNLNTEHRIHDTMIQPPETDPKHHLERMLARVSSEPGVYLMKDANGLILYVGKARNLKKRLASYFHRSSTKSGQDAKTEILVQRIAHFETILTKTEKEALILESNLIKEHRPRYNVILKDDKRYPSLRMDIRNTYPTLTIVRRTEDDGALYFGPFASSQAVHQTLKVINKTFKLRKCKTKEFKIRTRPCLHCQMDRCLAPCCLDVDKKTYHDMVKEVVLFLKGRTRDLIDKIKDEMMAAADLQDFEKAARLRDKMIAIQKTVEKQVAVTTDFKDRDVLALIRSTEISLVMMLFVRGGILMGKRRFPIPETISMEPEIISAFIRQYYEQAHFIPQEILVPIRLEDAPLLAERLQSIKGEKVGILTPRRGEKVRLVRMAVQNGENELKDLIATSAKEMELISRLGKRIRMDRVPLRIECFDNSNISGTEPVAAMVVFYKGAPEKKFYRRYKIGSVPIQNDYAYMAEVLKRRFGKGEASQPFPDLLVLDGGKGQLGIAVSILTDLGLHNRFEIIGIAKKDLHKGENEDKIYKPGRANPLNFRKTEDIYLFLQKVRNEAHRFAISFHRKRRTTKAMRSRLDSIPFIGKKRKESLLKHFKSIDGIKSASLAELSMVPGMNRTAAQAVKDGFRNQGDRKK